MSRLIVTNGQSGVSSIQRAGIEGDIFSWDDVLHDGPVPGGYDLAVLSELRARYIASVGWGEFDEVHKTFQQRDDLLKRAVNYEELVLFFEHDLYDQLQVLQILDLIANNAILPQRVTMAMPPNFIAYCEDEELQQAFKHRMPIDDTELRIGSEAWTVFTDENPQMLGEVIKRDMEALPHLKTSLIRLAEEYPHHETELSRTETAILRAVENEPLKTGPLFKAVQNAEEAAFMGDWSFMLRLNILCAGDNPLLLKIDEGVEEVVSGSPVNEDFMRKTIGLSDAGRQVLLGSASKSEFVPIDHWIGGTHLTVAALWKWHPGEQRFIL